jgi:hypothetical protein
MHNPLHVTVLYMENIRRKMPTKYKIKHDSYLNISTNLYISLNAYKLTAPALFNLISICLGFVVDKMALEQAWFEYFCFPCQFWSHQLLRILRYTI